MKNSIIVILTTFIILAANVFADPNTSVNTPVPTFTFSVSPGKTINSGENITFNSVITVFTRGKIMQTLIIHDSDNHSVILKNMSKEIGQGIGTYKSAFSFSFPKGMSPGEYPVTSQILLDNIVVTSKIMLLELK